MSRFVKRMSLGAFPFVAVGLAICWRALPRGPRDPMPYQDFTGRSRELVRASDYAAATGTPWATEAAVTILARGRSACNAAVGAITARDNGRLLAGAGPREETTASRR